MQEAAGNDAPQAGLQACSILLPQFPWEDASSLNQEVMEASVLPCLQRLLTALSTQAAAGMSNGEEVAAVLFKEESSPECV